MMQAIKSEFRKLLTIRSTYIVSGLALLIVSAIAFYFTGIKADDARAPLGPQSLQSTVLALTMVVGIFMGIVAVLSICHEYRYNTISYSITITNRRFKVLLAKAFTIIVYAVVMALLTLLLAGLLTPLGAQLGNATMPPQDFVLWNILWRMLAYMIGSVMLGMVIGFLFRNLAFSITAYMMIPTAIEPLLINLLKVDGNWLPYTAQGHLLTSGGMPDAFSPLASMGVLALYLAVGWSVAVVLFLRRDAN